MPPHKPIEDIDFPDLGNKILDLLYALWEFVCDIFLVLWAHVSHAFSAVWTWPPFETFRNEFTAALIALWEYVVAHPMTSVALCILVWVVIPTVFDALQVGVLHCVGYRRQGALRASYATSYQSTSYGGNVPRGSTFARLQSHGAKGGGGYRSAGATGSPT